MTKCIRTQLVMAQMVFVAGAVGVAHSTGEAIYKPAESGGSEMA
jgi:hypothetical protein